MTRRIRWGILATGFIADRFTQDLAQRAARSTVRRASPATLAVLATLDRVRAQIGVSYT